MNNVHADSQPLNMPSQCGSPFSLGPRSEGLRDVTAEKSHAFKTLLCALLCPFADQGCDVVTHRERKAVHS